MSEHGGRTTFTELYERVYALLAEGDVRPGGRVGIKSLASRLSVSPTPMREILSRLVGRDIVEERRAEGYYLKSYDDRQIADLYELHGDIIDIALRNDPPARDMLACPDQDIWTAFDLIVEATGNRALLDTRRYIDERLKIVRRCEPSVFQDLVEEAKGLRLLLTNEPLGKQRRGTKQFHDRRVGAARKLAFCLGRR